MSNKPMVKEYEKDIVTKSALDHFKYNKLDFDQGTYCFDMIILEDRHRTKENVQKILKDEKVDLTSIRH